VSRKRAIYTIPMPRSAPGLFNDEPTPKAGGAGWISAHCDGGARGNPGPAGYGAHIVDEKGQVLAELSEFLGFRTNNFAEYSGLLGCLQWALDHHHTHLRVVSDSELMVKQIQGKYKVNSPDLRPLWEEARRRIAQLEGFQITHALRHKNKDADRLANEAMDRGMKRPQTPGQPAPPVQATPYPTRASAPPKAVAKPEATMLRGFTRDGVVHVLGGAKLPDGVFVKIVVE
jgi:ribonuclease HI